jgi:hypothetical protein
MPVTGINFHNMPENRTAADIHHRLGAVFGFFPKPGSKAPAKDYSLHEITLILYNSLWLMIPKSQIKG